MERFNYMETLVLHSHVPPLGFFSQFKPYSVVYYKPASNVVHPSILNRLALGFRGQFFLVFILNLLK